MKKRAAAYPFKILAQACLAGVALVLVSLPVFADTSVRVTVPVGEPPLFLVSVSTHHADLHNGYSRTRFQEVLPGNERHRIDTGFYFTLVYYSAWAYHPDFLLRSVRSEGRIDALPDIEPEAWRELLAGLETLPITGPGPTYSRAVEHVHMYPSYYLPALDRADVPPAQGIYEELQAFLARAEQLAGLSGELSDSERNTVARLQAKAEKAFSELRLQLSLDAGQRVAVREFDSLTAGPRHMIEALVREPGLEKVADYLTALEKGAGGERSPDQPAWRGDSMDVKFTYSPGAHYRLRDPAYPEPLPCRRGSVQFDGRHLAGGLDPELVSSVAADFCRYPDGVWRLRSRWAG